MSPEAPPARAGLFRVLVCASCQQTFMALEDHDFDLCFRRFRERLLWAAANGKVIHVN